ncbi:MAG: copper chaperone PCu(A)C [Steroidobacteraceae bacterium]
MNGKIRVLIVSFGALLSASPATFACDLKIESAWIREPTPAQTELAGYAILENHGSRPLRITNISATAAGMAMLHETRSVGGVSRMEMLDSLSIPAGGRVVLAPGGKHLMLSDLKGPPRVGDHLKIEFQDDSGCTTTGDFIVRPISAEVN